MSMDDYRRKIESYYLNKRLSFSQRVIGRKRVFLDTNFWIRLRDASLGRDNGAGLELLELARSGMDDGRLIFPVSREIIIEILSQTDATTLLATADLVDELSLGLCLVTDVERRELEFLSQFRELEGAQKILIPDSVWTTVSYDNGIILPPFPGLNGEDLFNAWLENIDRMWKKTLRYRIEVSGYGNGRTFPTFPDISDALSQQKELHADDFKSWRDIYLSEVYCILSETRNIVDSLVNKGFINIEEDVHDNEQLEELLDGVAGDIRHHIYEKIKAGDGLEELSTVHIPSALMAAVCWDKRRKFKKNDWLDYMHGAAGIAFSEIFCTEKPLRTILCRKDMKLDEQYPCTICDTVEEACSALRSS